MRLEAFRCKKIDDLVNLHDTGMTAVLPKKFLAQRCCDSISDGMRQFFNRLYIFFGMGLDWADFTITIYNKPWVQLISESSPIDPHSSLNPRPAFVRTVESSFAGRLA